MNEQDVEALVDILLTADGGCIFCGADLCQKVAEQFPQYRAQIEAVFKDRKRQELFDL